jgi:hypothetical protein
LELVILLHGLWGNQEKVKKRPVGMFGETKKRNKTTNGKKNKYTRTNESGEIFQRVAQALNRNISRVQSGNLGKVSQQGKKVGTRIYFPNENKTKEEERKTMRLFQ